MDLSIVHCRNASTRGDLLRTLRRAWCCQRFRESTKLSSKAVTIDHHGRPTVSYNDGDPGFVRVLDGKTVALPCYDGNGMFYSMGNLLGNPQVGMLFVISKTHTERLIQTCNQHLVVERLARKPVAPAASACARAFISGKAVRKMIGR
jgi:hypothetical protein